MGEARRTEIFIFLDRAFTWSIEPVNSCYLSRHTRKLETVHRSASNANWTKISLDSTIRQYEIDMTYRRPMFSHGNVPLMLPGRWRAGICGGDSYFVLPGMSLIQLDITCGLQPVSVIAAFQKSLPDLFDREVNPRSIWTTNHACSLLESPWVNSFITHSFIKPRLQPTPPPPNASIQNRWYMKKPSTRSLWGAIFR